MMLYLVKSFFFMKAWYKYCLDAVWISVQDKAKKVSGPDQNFEKFKH